MKRDEKYVIGDIIHVYTWNPLNVCLPLILIVSSKKHFLDPAVAVPDLNNWDLQEFFF